MAAAWLSTGEICNRKGRERRSEWCYARLSVMTNGQRTAIDTGRTSQLLLVPMSAKDGNGRLGNMNLAGVSRVAVFPLSCHARLCMPGWTLMEGKRFGSVGCGRWPTRGLAMAVLLSRTGQAQALLGSRKFRL